MSNALSIAASAYRQANLDQPLTSFATTQEWPYAIALDIFNTVLQEMNSLGNYYFAQTSLVLPYSAGSNSWNLATLETFPFPAIEPNRIIRLRSELPNYWLELTEINYRRYQLLYASTTIPTKQPSYWAKFQDVIYTDSIPDQNYNLTLYYYQDMPIVQNTTDTLIVPQQNEDVVRDGIYAYLLQRMGRPDYSEAYQLFIKKATKLLALIEKDAGLPNQRPAAF